MWQQEITEELNSGNVIVHGWFTERGDSILKSSVLSEATEQITGFSDS